MGKTKSAQPVKASKPSKDTQVKSISSVKEGAVTKPSQTPKAKSKEMAKQVAMNATKANKKSHKPKKEPTPASSSESGSEEDEDDEAESDASSASSDESEEEAPAPKQAVKTNGVKANGVAKVAAKVNAESSDSSESSASDDEAKPAAKAGAVAKDGSDSDEEGTSEGTSDGTSDEESDDEDAAPNVPKPVNAKALNSKLEKVASKEASSEDESASDASSASSESSSEEDDSEEEEAPAPKKRKAEPEAIPAAKKAKTDIDLNDESKKNLFIGHLSYNVDEEWLTREFEKFGELTRVKVMTDRESGQSRGFGYVEFANTADSVKAHGEMQDVEIDGRAINVDFSKPKDAATPRQDRQKSYGDSLSAPSETLFVANLSFDVTEDAVAEEFGKHGSVLGVRLPTDMNSGAPKGFGYVQFASVEDAKEAMGKMSGATIMGRPIRLDYSTPRPPRDNDSPRGGRGGRGGFDRGGRGGGRGRGGFDRGGRGGGRGGFDRGRGGRGGASTNRGGVGEFKGQKMRLE